jgi:methyl-accepting chemotaxis protein
VTSELYPKISYVKKYEPWGWVLGSGLYVDDLQRNIAVFKWSTVAFSLIFAAFLLVLSLLTGRSISRTLGYVTNTLDDMSRGGGDLTRRIAVEREDESGILVQAFNRFLDNLKGIVGGLDQSAENVAAASEQLTSTASQIASGSENVASQTASVSVAAEQMAAMSSDIARNCVLAVENSNRASQTALSGSKVVNHAVRSIQRISLKVQESAGTVESLGKRSEQIGQIIGTIEDIADQTNLLALNAAIEAARAGEQGRGFAVVADEVRALAERTTKATHEIGGMIKIIQQETKTAVSVMEAGVLEVAQGTNDAASSGKALDEILEQVAEVTNQINQIATAAGQQTITTSEISINMKRITGVIQQTSQSSHETATAACKLSKMSQDLKKVVGQFRF